MDKEIVLHIYNGILLNHKEGWISISWTKVDVPQLRYVQTCLPLWDSMDCSMAGLPVHHQLLELAQTQVYQVGDATQQSQLLSSPSPPAFKLSQHQGLFQWIISSHQVAKVLVINISPSNEHPGLISFRMDWLGLLVVQGTLKSLLQHHSSKVSILQCSAFFIVQLSHPYMTTGKNHSFDYTDLC